MTSDLGACPCSYVLFNHAPVFVVEAEAFQESFVFGFGPSAVLGYFVGSCKAVMGKRLDFLRTGELT